MLCVAGRHWRAWWYTVCDQCHYYGGWDFGKEGNAICYVFDGEKFPAMICPSVCDDSVWRIGWSLPTCLLVLYCLPAYWCLDGMGPSDASVIFNLCQICGLLSDCPRQANEAWRKFPVSVPSCHTLPCLLVWHCWYVCPSWWALWPVWRGKAGFPAFSTSASPANPIWDVASLPLET